MMKSVSRVLLPLTFSSILQLGIPAGIQGAIFSVSNVFIQSGINLFGKKVPPPPMRSKARRSAAWASRSSLPSSPCSAR